MIFERKTSDGAWWQMLLLPAVVLMLFFASLALFGPKIGFWVLGGIYAVFSIYPMIVFFKMKNPGHLIQSAFFVSVSLIGIAFPFVIDNDPAEKIIVVPLAFMYISMLMLAYQTINRKMKWRGFEILELAALSVENGGTGYTPRPRPVGQVEISKTEIARFTDFVTRELIALVFYEADSIFFVPVMLMLDVPYMLGIKQDFMDETWIGLDAEGKLSVHISEKDYLRYKTDLDFDRLCESMGEVFAEFIELSKQGEEGRIIDKMNALRLPIFS